MAEATDKSSTKLDPAAYAAYLLREARLGNTAPLAGHVRLCAHRRRPLSPELGEFLAELLERFEGKRGKDELRRLERDLIRQQVKGLLEEGKLKPKAAVGEVVKSRGLSRSKIYTALRESKTRK